MSETAISREEAPRNESVFAAMRTRRKVASGEAPVASRVVCAGTVVYAALFLFAAIVHFAVFKEARFDLGNMVQAIWSTLHGHFLETTTLYGHQRDRLGFHVDPLLLLFVPLFWIWSSPLLLLVVQVLAVTSGALPVFWLARKHLGSPRTAAAFSFAYLLYPATQFNAFTFDGFHPVSFAIPLVLYAIWFLDEDRLLAFSAVALLACTTKEELPLALGCLGVWYAVRTGRWLFGASVFVTGLAITLTAFLWVIPHFSPTGGDPFVGRYASVGGSPAGIVQKLFTDPAAFAHALATDQDVVYLLLLLLPFFGLWALEPLILLGALPDLAINLLAGRSEQASILFQDTAGIAPFVVAASIYGATRFKGMHERVVVCVMVSAACFAVISPILSLPKDVGALGSPQVAAARQAIDLVPAGVAVSATNRLAGYLSERRFIYTFPAVGRSQWIIVDINDRSIHIAKFTHRVLEYESDKAWRIVFSSRGVVVLHRRSS